MPPKHKNTKSHKKDYEPIPENIELIGKKIVDAAYTVHKNLGPGLLEKVYEVCFCHELEKRNLSYLRQVDIPIVYDDIGGQPEDRDRKLFYHFNDNSLIEMYLA